MSILAKILEHKQKEVAEAKRRVSLRSLEDKAKQAWPVRDFATALRAGVKKPRVIAEFKRASPSVGPIRPGADAVAVARDYEQAGAAAISVLTDEKFFAGSLADLTAVRAAVSVPVLRKDFVIDPYQVLQARAAGADAVLLIVAALSNGQLDELASASREQGLAMLIEVHDEAEVERALRMNALIIGVNHRNLKTFEIDMSLTARLRSCVSKECLLVGESGIKAARDVAALAAAGADAILVGESLMKEPSPGKALRELRGEPPPAPLNTPKAEIG